MFTGNEIHNISLTDAAVMTRAYRQGAPSARKGGFFGKAAIQTILAQQGCVGIRYYHGLNSKGEPVIILVGTDANENDIHTGAIMEFAIPCPTQCGVNNSLNS